MKDRYAERQKTASLKDKRLITILRYILVLCPLSIVLCYFTGCSEYKVSDDPTLRLSFSHDTVRFDTVFTAQGSATMQVKVYNRNSNALLIDRVWMENGQFFRVNTSNRQGYRPAALNTEIGRWHGDTEIILELRFAQ